MSDHPDTATTAALLDRARGGDAAAREAILARYLPLLRRWAHGRLPPVARGMTDTDDLVQVCLLRALQRIGEFEYRREGAFLAYLRSAVLNAVRDEVRRAGRRPAAVELHDRHADRRPSPVEEAVGRETFERYEAALAELTELQREAVIMRLEFDYSYADVAAAIGSPSPDAARMAVARALAQLATAMDG